MKVSKTVPASEQCVRTADMKPHPGVYRRPGSNRWQFQLQTPADLRPLFASQWACRLSLGTAELAEANAHAKLLHAEWEAKFAELRGQPVRRPRVHVQAPALASVQLTHELIQQAAALMHQRMLEADETTRMAVLSGPEMETQALALEIEASLLKRAYATGDSSLVESILTTWLTALGMEVSEGDPLRPTLARELVKARLRAIQARQARHLGELVDTPSEPATGALELAQGHAAIRLPPSEKPAHLLTLRDVYELWCNKRPKKPAPKSVSVAGRVVDAFEEVCGNPPLSQLTRKHGLQLRDHFLSTGMAPVTAGDRLGWVSTLLRFEMSEGQRVESNPWANIKVDGSSEAVIERQAVSLDQMRALFSDELFQAYRLPSARNAGRDAAYWLPIMGAYTGARITELAQLLLTDLKRINGLWVLTIAASEEWQSVKNKDSKRSIPLHPELVRLGLPEYAAALSETGHTRLFPLVPVSEVNNAGGAFSSWFSKLKTGHGWGAETTFHSFRHTVETLLRRAEAYPLHIDKYVGHKHVGSEGSKTYTKVVPEDLVRLVGLIQHDSIALPRVFPPAGWSAPPAVVELVRTERR